MLPRHQSIIGRWVPSAGATALTLVDRSPCRRNGALVNMDPASDWVISGGKGALDFDNSNDQVSIPSIASIRSGPFTVSLWYYPFSVSGINQIFAQWLSNGIIAFRNGTSLAWQITNRVTTGAVFTANAWHHIVCFRQADGTLRAMVNGVLDSGSIPAANQSSTEPFILGGPVSGAGTGAGNCQMDDIVIFGDCITFGEAREIYRRGRGAGLVEERRRPIRSAVTTNRRRRLLTGAEC
jgi:hypothetical protein